MFNRSSIASGGGGKFYIIGGMSDGAGYYGYSCFMTDDFCKAYPRATAQAIYEDDTIKVDSLASGTNNGSTTVTYKKACTVDSVGTSSSSSTTKTAGTTETVTTSNVWYRITPL